MENDLLLLSGNDIPFYGAQVSIHQPTIKEIAYIGEEAFYTGCEFLRFSKDKLTEEDRNSLENKTNFEIIMSIIREQNMAIQQQKTAVLMLLSLIFPNYTIHFNVDTIDLGKPDTDEVFKITSKNYDEFLDILNSMFCLKATMGNADEYAAEGELAKRIADKLRKRHQKIAEQQSESKKKVAILSRYVSIIATGQQKNINDILGYTVYQLFDEFQRYQLKINFDIYLQAKMAGAKDLEEVDDWMKDIHSDTIE